MKKTKVGKVEKTISCDMSSLRNENTIISTEIQEECPELICKMYQKIENISSDPESEEYYSQYIDQLVNKVLDDINSDRFSLELARIGFDMNSDCNIFDYDLAFSILTSNGYCPQCADNFLDALSWTMSDDNLPEYMFIRRKEISDIKVMLDKYSESLLEKEQSERTSKKKSSKKQAKREKKHSKRK